MYHLRAHSAWRSANCAGSTKFIEDIEKEFGKHDVPEAKAGRDMHQLVDEIMNGKAKLSSVTGEPLEHIARCLDFIEKHGYSGQSEVTFELRTPLQKDRKTGGRDNRLVARCRADYVDVVDDAVVVVDWKFYHEPLEKEETEWQMKVTIVAAAMDQGLKKGYAKLFLPILGLTYEYEVPDVEKAYEEILEVWERINSDQQLPLSAGPWCARCPVLARCPAAQSTMNQLATQANLGALWGSQELPTLSVMETAFYGEMETWSPARFRGVVEWLPVVGPFEKAVKRLLRENLETDPHSHKGWELRSKNLPATGDPAVLEEVSGDYLTLEEFNACKKLSVAQLRKALVEALVTKGECSTKKEAGFAVEAILGPHVEVKTTTELRRKKL